MEKKCKKAKWLSGEALQIAVKKREAKSKGEKERYKHLNAEFQRIERRDKKAFFSDQCKEIDTRWEAIPHDRSVSSVSDFQIYISKQWSRFIKCSHRNIRAASTSFLYREVVPEGL